MLKIIKNICKIACSAFLVLSSYSSFAIHCDMNQTMVAIANTSNAAATLKISAKHQDEHQQVAHGNYSVAPGEYSTVCLPSQSKITKIAACISTHEDVCMYQTFNECPDPHEPIARIFISNEYPPIIS